MNTEKTYRTIEYTAGETDIGKSAAKFLKARGFGYELMSFLKNTGGISINGEAARACDLLKSGDRLAVTFREEEWEAEQDPGLPVKLLYEDEDTAVFDKPAGIPSHQSRLHPNGTLANYFAALYPGTVFRAVNRLDRNTSGLVLTAKHKLAASRLMSDRRYKPEKLYYAVVSGNVAEKLGISGVITAPIAREREDFVKRCVRSDGQFAETAFRVLKNGGGMSFIELKLHTGRTHQIRVHFANEGFPLMGDELYGGDTALIGRQALHCGFLRFTQPVTGEPVELFSDIPEDMQRLVSAIDQ